jgi:Ala-tRNA(Pro) deacylase
MRIPTFLAEHRVPFETIVHPPAYTAQKRAKYLHVPGARVAKCVLLKGPAGFLVAVLPAPRHVDTTRLAIALGGPVRVAEEREVADVFRDCEWGVATPFGQLYGVPTILDESLSPEDLIVVETNSHMEAVRLRVRDFIELEQPRRLSFAR